MKKKYIAGVSAAVLLAFTGVSCSNFISGSDLSKEIQKKVDRANSQDINVSFVVRHSFQGKIFASSEGKCKLNDVITVSFEANPDYECSGFEAIDQDTKKYVSDAVEGLNSFIENSNGVSIIYSTNIKLVKPVNNLLIRPKCVWVKDNTAPLKVESEDYPQMVYTFAVSDENIEKAVKENSWKTESGYPESNEARNAENNRSRGFSFKLACIEQDNEIESVIIKETVIESENGENIGVVTEWELKREDLFITQADSEGMYVIEPQSLYPLKLNSVSEGLIQVDLHVKDSRKNVSEVLASKLVMKDTSIGDLSEAVRYDNFGIYEPNYDPNDEGSFSVEEFVDKFHTLTVDTDSFRDISVIDGNDDGVKMYIGFTQGGETKDYSSETGVFFEYDENALDPVVRIKKVTDGVEYFNFDKDFIVNITVTDKTGNKNEYIKRIKCSNKPMLATKIKGYDPETGTDSADYLAIKWNDTFNGEKTDNICAYYTVNSGEASAVFIKDTDKISFDSNLEYHICMFSRLTSDDDLESGSITYRLPPSEFMVYTEDNIITSETILAKTKKNGSEMFSSSDYKPVFDITNTEDGKYRLIVSYLRNNGDAYYVCYGDKLWALCNKEDNFVVFDNVPGSFLVNKDTTKLDFVKIKEGKALYFKGFTVSDSSYPDLEAPIVPEKYPDENLGTGMFGGNGFYSGEGSVFSFHIVDNFSITKKPEEAEEDKKDKKFECKIYYTTESAELTEENIKKLPFKKVSIPESEDSCPYGAYENYSHTMLSVDCADFDNGNYAFYIWLKDYSGNESITRMNAGFFTLPDKGLITITNNSTGIKIYTHYNGDKAFDGFESLNYDEKFSKWVTVQEYYDNRNIYMKDEDMPDVIPDSFVKVILSATSNPYAGAGDIMDYAYPFYYYASNASESCSMKTYEYDGDVLLVYSDYPVLVETLCSKKALGDDPDYWNRHTLGKYRLNTKVLHPAVEGKVSMMAYKVDTSEVEKAEIDTDEIDASEISIEEGYYYTVVMHFADGTSKIAEVKRK